MEESPAAKRRKLIFGVVAIGIATLMMTAFSSVPMLPTISSSYNSSATDILFCSEGQKRRNAGSMALANNHAGAPRYKSDTIFWESYHGDEDFFY
jgi:hypothetical protein